ncbi:L-serine ammonia-lyase [Burkholderia multivorans]|uniref:L-serine ammonia-lyase n=1 Tax=Burkholderia multivorans TaxID=87883 RepID=UPI00018E3216|nr:L-serine ammonia-lyase [Burkholderia multivorans]EED98989.1 L-serine ammonia-lyase [Burkholderia multivorans CGD1]MCO8319725.1 L-serine ammonia-lyase [Burkholderia multivorans]MCO8429842.1 L-serine ammonia-lyase [Burkholderia multivorans]MCO8441252.1 L-serine ammonia-lyase [Burkholderia multivorans]MCO8547364.1 L-serine ammonia-lyase [Burkholderia multivorans]
MNVSAFDLFKVGIGPSSSHTVGPMIAASRFVTHMRESGVLGQVRTLHIELYGSLGATGKGHGTDKAVLLGLEGNLPDTVDPDYVEQRLVHIRTARSLDLAGVHRIDFDEKTQLAFLRREVLPFHPNGMRFTALDERGAMVDAQAYYSVGGGFVVDDEGERLNGRTSVQEVPYPFRTGVDLLRLCGESGLSIADVMLANETTWRNPQAVRAGLLTIRDVMAASIARGCSIEGTLPGPMKVRRRASTVYRQLKAQSEESLRDPLSMIDWINLYAMAVNEENAAGGRIVTAPTNGAAGIIPAVLQYYTKFVAGSNDDGVVTFLLTAAAIGLLYKENASISGAEVGCQGEVGVACSMAAGALAAVLGGTPEQVENAAEIGMEHNLGMTCDPVGGLVQIPCIERNAMGAVKALNAARMALRGNGKHYVSLDKVIKTMRETGADMKTKYKETSRGGLAVNVIEC